MDNSKAPAIGITETQDVGLDLSWAGKMHTVDGAVIITKNPGAAGFRDAVLDNKSKVILHATVTGNGHTVFEPNVPAWQQALEDLRAIISAGFPAQNVVLRCDPIIPTPQGLTNAHLMLEAFADSFPDVSRVRVSILDNYPHVRKRFEDAGIKPLYGGAFTAPYMSTVQTARMLAEALRKRPDIRIECCAEPTLSRVADGDGLISIRHTGCVDEEDLRLLGITLPEDMLRNRQNRNGCRCLACKKQLLGRPGHCPHGCLYCFWK